MTSIEDYMQHEVAELICLKCLNRWIGTYPSSTLLKEIECKCGEVGYVIKTGQSIETEEKECSTCKYSDRGKCKLKLLYDPDMSCGYYVKNK